MSVLAAHNCSQSVARDIQTGVSALLLSATKARNRQRQGPTHECARVSMIVRAHMSKGRQLRLHIQSLSRQRSIANLSLAVGSPPARPAGTSQHACMGSSCKDRIRVPPRSCPSVRAGGRAERAGEPSGPGGHNCLGELGMFRPGAAMGRKHKHL